LPTNPGRIDHLVCVVDGDRIADILPDVGAIPANPSSVERWHANAERSFVSELRRRCTEAGVPSDTVHGAVLRWSKESVVLAAYDLAAAREKLGIDLEEEKTAAFLATCKPPPAGILAADFINTYRKPIKCIDGLRTARGLSALGKAPEHDDVLNALSSEELDVACKRARDMDRVVDLVWSLTATSSPPAVAARVPAAPQRGPAPKSARKGSAKRKPKKS
jgi:hypothetical protein